MQFSQSAIVLTAAISLLCTPAAAQTFSSCNPRFTSESNRTQLATLAMFANTSAACPADPALGRSISVDFTQGGVDSFQAVGGPTYASDGVYFTVDSSGDAPQLVSRFYIMFGKVSITMKAAPGAGIVSSLVLQSDTLDEIDFEWLGAAPNEVQTNYFGKGDVTTYNRGAFHQTPENQQQWITYDVEWTATNIIWSVGGSVLRVLTPASADANQYPQTPMQIKFGSWSGGDSANPEGTIAWARGPTNYGNGPFSMVVKSISISDYSTGTAYEYRGNSGDMGDIVAIDGAIGAIQGTTASTPSAAPSASSVSPSVPAGIGASQTGWPYHVQSTLTTATPSPTITIAGVPSGWVVAANGKIVPANSAAVSMFSLSHLIFDLRPPI